MRAFKIGLMVLLVCGLYTIPAALFAQDMSPAQIKDKAEEAISMTYLGDRGITVDVNQHKVTLKGSVKTLYDKEKAFEAVSKVPGVKEISNQIVVDHQVVPEKIIQENIESLYELSTSLPEWQNITVGVDNDLVILRGTVSFYYEKMIAENLAATQDGVRGVANEINVKPLEKAISDENLESYLKKIVRERFPAEDNIKITVDNGEVTIDGEANSMWAAYNIEREFAQVIGVKDIDNMLLINS